jgi:hypothetical protein
MNILHVSDTEAANQIIDQAYEFLRLSFMGRDASPEDVSRLPYCGEVSGIVTRVALELGYFAVRETHESPWDEDMSHLITAFPDPNRKYPSELDPVLCLTLGQFKDEAAPGNRPSHFFGERQGMACILPSLYSDAYSSQSVARVETAYVAPPRGHELRRSCRWLSIRPSEFRSGNYPVGRISLKAARALGEDRLSPKMVYGTND